MNSNKTLPKPSTLDPVFLKMYKTLYIKSAVRVINVIRYKKKSNTHKLREAASVCTLLLCKGNIGTAAQQSRKQKEKTVWPREEVLRSNSTG